MTEKMGDSQRHVCRMHSMNLDERVHSVLRATSDNELGYNIKSGDSGAGEDADINKNMMKTAMTPSPRTDEPSSPSEPAATMLMI